MPGGVLLAPAAVWALIWGMVIGWVVDNWSTGPDEGGVPESEAPTGISQRWPGSPWGGLGSVTVLVLADGACASTGAELIVVVGADGAVFATGVVLSSASSCWEEQAVRATKSESPRRWMRCMITSPGSCFDAGKRYKVGNSLPVRSLTGMCRLFSDGDCIADPSLVRAFSIVSSSARRPP